VLNGGLEIRKGSDLLLTPLKYFIEKRVQGQTPGSMLIWVLFLNKLGKKMKY